jgi:hypothetical protein
MPDPEAVNRSANEMKSEIHSGADAFDSLIRAVKHLDPKGPLKNMAGGLTGQGIPTTVPQYSKESIIAARQTWKRFRYVKIGLFSVDEGMKFVEYFYTKCMPFTPVVVPDYRDPATHHILLDKEPFLLMAILTIASRFMSNENSTRPGAISRPQIIHQRLFKDTQKLMDSLIYAQEQFGGGLTGGGRTKGTVIDPLRRYGLRSITTVEALLLLCEWAPRALHFPPEDDLEFMTPLNEAEEDDVDANDQFIPGDGEHRRESWLEPAWRCDTMIWMFLHCGMALALEIGLFEDRPLASYLSSYLSTNPKLSRNEVEDWYVRKMRTRDIYWAFYVQTCGRLEFIGKMPSSYLESLNYNVADVRIRKAVEILKNNYRNDPYSRAPVAHPAMRSSRPLRTHGDATYYFWQEITAIMKSGNQTMFPRKEETRRITRDGEYRMWINVYGPLLDEWRREFDQCDLSKFTTFDSCCQILTLSQSRSR